VVKLTGRTESDVDAHAQPIYGPWASQAVPISTTILAVLGQIELHLTASGVDRAEAGAALDAAIDDADADLDWSLNDGVLNIDCGKRGKLVVNRHVPNREMWIAAKSGGFHLRAEDGAWRDTRSGEELAAALARLMREQAAIDVTLPALTSVAAIR